MVPLIFVLVIAASAMLAVLIHEVPINAWLMNVWPPWITKGAVTFPFTTLITPNRSACIRIWL